MQDTILFVDDDRILRSRVQKMFTLYGNDFQTLTAGNGAEAMRILVEVDISLVVTDLKMPEKDGFGLLAHLSQYYADIPVIIVTGHHSSAARKLVLKKSAAGFLEKPFELDELGRKIKQVLKKEREGGTLNSISLEIFSQLIEMEMKTCTLRVIKKGNNEMGVLFFREGVLMDARLKNVHGKAAALKIFAWEDVGMAIRDNCPVTERRIDAELQTVVMDAARLKDEGVDPTAGHVFEAVGTSEAPALEINRIHQKLNSISGSEQWLKTIVQDDRFDPFLAKCRTLGDTIRAGELKACYIHEEGSSGTVAVPGIETTLVTVDISCPWDMLLRTLSW